MAARLTDERKKRILADYIDEANYSSVARRHNVSATTVKNLVRDNPEFVEKCEDKKRENSEDILAHMEKRKDLVCAFIDKGLEMLNDPDKLASASLSQITTAMGTVIDKWALIGGGPGDDRVEDALSRSLRERAEELDRDAE